MEARSDDSAKSLGTEALPQQSSGEAVPAVVARLAPFKQRTPHAEINETDGMLCIDKPFSYPDSQLAFELTDEVAIEDLNSIGLKQQFDAIFHHDENVIEFIYSFLSPASPSAGAFMDRRFKVVFNSETVECYFGEPTERLFRLAKAFRRIPSTSSVGAGRQLSEFRDSQRLEELPDRAKKYFENRVPRSFFIRPESKLDDVNLESLAKRLNFLMQYYDRNTAMIVIREKAENPEKDEVAPVRFINGSFPGTLVSRELDEVTLKLLEVARESGPRLAFLYYYQIFEYAGFHYIDAKAKASLLRVLRDPAIHQNLPQKIGEIFSSLSDVAHHDDARMLKVIEEVCEPAELWTEVENRREFFTKELAFVGGFNLPALIAKDTSKDSWIAMWTPKLFSHLTKIRNCLVHAREKRENRVILPDGQNDAKIECYISVIRRMAEQIALSGSEF